MLPAIVVMARVCSQVWNNAAQNDSSPDVEANLQQLRASLGHSHPCRRRTALACSQALCAEMYTGNSELQQTTQTHRSAAC